MIDSESLMWLLTRIRDLEKMATHHRWPTHSNIWAGSYDVWMCEQDRIDAIEIPRSRIRDAEELGFIKSEIRTRGKYNFTVWTLTGHGKEYIDDKNQETSK